MSRLEPLVLAALLGLAMSTTAHADCSDPADDGLLARAAEGAALGELAPALARRAPVSPCPLVHLLHGAALRDAEDLEGALDAFEAGLEEHPEHASLGLERAGTLARLGRLAEAIAAYETLRRRPLDDAAARGAALGHGRALLWAGRPADAAAVFEAWLGAHPDDADAFAGLGSAERAQLRRRAARDAYDEALRLDPSQGEAREAREGLRRDRRVTLSAHGGLAFLPSESAYERVPRYGLEAQVRATPRWTIAARAEEDLRRSPGGGSAFDGPSTGFERATTLEASAAYRLDAPELTLSAGARWQRRGGANPPVADEAALLLGASWRAGSWVTLLTTRVGNHAEGGLGHLSMLGLQRLLGGDAWVMAQVFRAGRAARAPGETALVLTGFVPLHARLAVRASGGASLTDAGVRGGSLSTALVLSLGPAKDQQLALRGDVAFGTVPLRVVDLAFTVRF
ncbi:MAG: tetratricopeptide repeat protein [Myxococcota bacterium]